MQYHWLNRANLSPDNWSLDLGVWDEGRFVGVQGVSTHDFPVTRTGETGSWLGQEFHGRGLGTLMRQAMCVLCFDHLGFEEVTSAAFSDNPAVARGEPQGRLPRERRGAATPARARSPRMSGSCWGRTTWCGRRTTSRWSGAEAFVELVQARAT